MLHTPDYGDGARPFCGPTAIAAVTGESFKTIYKKIRRYRSERERPRAGGRILRGGSVLDCLGRKIPIRGMGNIELLEVMRRFGFKPKPHQEHGMTLRAFCDDRGHIGPFIVNVTGHYVAVSHGMICDTKTKVPVPIAEYEKLGYRVKRYWLFQ